MLADRVPAQGPEREWLSSALEAANRIQDVIGGMHQITRLEYLSLAKDLPSTLDIRRSSQEHPGTPPPGP